LKFLCIKL